MQAKPTMYNGYRFRSKLEAKWAVFFDGLKIPYQYESEAFVCSDGSQYTPDFFLPASYLRSKDGMGLYLEIKPVGWQEDETYTERISSAFGKNGNLVLCVGDPLDVMMQENSEPNQQLAPWWDNYMVLMHCEPCNVLKAEFNEGNYYKCPICSGPINGGFAGSVAQFARNYRFEFHQ